MIQKLALPHQGLFLQSPFLFPDRRNHLLVAGYGAGKTSSLGMQVESLARRLQGLKDKEGHRARILLGGVTLEHLEKTTLSYIIQDLDNSHTIYKHDTKANILHIGTVDVILQPLQNPKMIMGYDVWAALLDEVDDLGLSAAEDTTFEAIKAVNERTRQRLPGQRSPFICMASTSQGQKGLYRLYTSFKKNGTGFVLIRGSTYDNWHLDPTYVKSMYDMYSERERKVYLEGEFLSVSRGQVFSDFDWARNYLDAYIDNSVNENEVLYWGQDFNQGYHRGSIYVVRGDTIYAIKRYEFPEIRSAPMVIRSEFPNNRIYFIPDVTAKDEVAHFMKELSRYDIRYVARSKNPLVEDSAFLVNKMLYLRRLMFAKGARVSAEMISLAQRDKNGQIPKGIGQSCPIHDCDSVRMVVYFLVCNKKEFADVRRITVDRHKWYEEEDESRKEIFSDGYRIVSA